MQASQLRLSHRWDKSSREGVNGYRGTAGESSQTRALEAELEDWRMESRIIPELLKGVISFEALIDPGMVSGILHL